jgi:hypothetical protein
MNRGSLRLRTVTRCELPLVFNAAVKPAVSFRILGRSESGVFMRTCLMAKFLKQTQVFCRAAQVLEAPESFFPQGFFRLVAQPAEL